MAQNIKEMIYKEEKILFPEALNRMTEEEWGEIREQEEEIGYFDVTPSDAWKPQTAGSTSSEVAESKKERGAEEGLIPLFTGALTRKQINLLLTHLPVDVTMVDENDQVRYFTQGKERIFDRSAAIIGREVIKCHPPQSAHRVVQILNDFRSGKRDEAEFWLQLGDKFVHIRYFALRDADGAYQGCIEVSQDVSHIRQLQGEKRLLDEEQESAE